MPSVTTSGPQTRRTSPGSASEATSQSDGAPTTPSRARRNAAAASRPATVASTAA